MILADKWKDYEILECGDGMKKERWGNFILVRPDPQVIWPLNSSDWGKYDAFYHRSGQGGGKWEYQTQLPESWKINYRNSVLKIKPTDFKHTGLFPEQAKSPPKVLNLFGYTGGATIAAAAAGASVCHVDAAKGMVAWCRENAALSNLSDAPIRYIVDDCMKFVEREIRRGTQYDGIIMDPPSYGRGKKGEVWQFDRDLWKFLQKCRQLLTPKPLFFLVNAYTTGVSPIVVGNLVRETLGNLDGTVTSGEIGIPISKSLNALPCGLFARGQRR